MCNFTLQCMYIFKVNYNTLYTHAALLRNRFQKKYFADPSIQERTKANKMLKLKNVLEFLGF